MGDVVLFFFFQAEDGIRDVAVTGVQTCALPIVVENSKILEIISCSVLLSRPVFAPSETIVANSSGVCTTRPIWGAEMPMEPSIASETRLRPQMKGSKIL